MHFPHFVHFRFLDSLCSLGRQLKIKPRMTIVGCEIPGLAGDD